MKNHDFLSPLHDALKAELDQRAADGLLRRELCLRHTPAGWRDAEGRLFLNFASNDYLGFSRRPELRAAAALAAAEEGAGAGASRLVSGTRPSHLDLEQAVAHLKGYPAARLFPSGMMAAMGVIPALVDNTGEVFADRLAHACLLDGATLSGARLRRFHHNDPGHLRTLLSKSRPGARKLVVTESVFSMDGDIAPLADLAAVAGEFDAVLLVDEAHATGVWGPCGAGVVSAERLQDHIAVSMGTFSKALGAQGGFICGSQLLADWIIHAARTYIYTTAPAPAVVAAAREAIRLLEDEPDAPALLQGRASAFRERLAAAGFNTLQSRTQIIPVLIGGNAEALRVAEALKTRGILAPAIRPPTVPPGTARLRISICLDHTDEDLDHLFDALCAAFAETGVARCPR